MNHFQTIHIYKQLKKGAFDAFVLLNPYAYIENFSSTITEVYSSNAKCNRFILTRVSNLRNFATVYCGAISFVPSFVVLFVLRFFLSLFFFKFFFLPYFFSLFHIFMKVH